MNRVRRFVRFLIDRGIVESIPSPAENVVEEPVGTFQRWLRDHRGLSDRTIDRHGRMVLRLLPALGRDPGTYAAALVRRVILPAMLAHLRQDDDDGIAGLPAFPGRARCLPPRA